MISQLILLGMALGLNNALASVALGTIQMPRRNQLRTAVLFALFEAIMPILGLFIGETLAKSIGGKARLVGSIVLVLIALYALFKRQDKDDDAKTSEGVRPVRTMSQNTLLLAVVLSLDNLSVGFGLGMFNVPIWLAGMIFGIVSLAMTFAGLEIGRHLGRRIRLSADKISGVVLLLVAGMLLLQ